MLGKGTAHSPTFSHRASRVHIQEHKYVIIVNRYVTIAYGAEYTEAVT